MLIMILRTLLCVSIYHKKAYRYTRDLLLHLYCLKSMGSYWIHPRVMRELADMIAEPFSIICQQLRSQMTGDLLM